jgi:mercuric reductase
MSQVVEYALNRLLGLLPLAARQATLSPELRKVHHAFLRSLVERGRPLTEAEIAAAAPGHDALTAVWTLASLDLIVLGRNGLPVGAYPVTTETTPHQVTVNGNSIWAMCALDAVAVAPMFNTKVSIHSRCPVTGAEITIKMSGGGIVELMPGPEVQLGVWWRDPGAVAAKNFCPGVMFLRDIAAARVWQGGHAADHDFSPIGDAAHVAERFFRPLMIDAPVVALA